jgi:hypothetical protein
MQELLATRFLGAVGLEAVFTNVSDGAQAAKALLDGAGDICMLAGFGPVLPAIEGGAKLKVVAGANLLSAWVLGYPPDKSQPCCLAQMNASNTPLWETASIWPKDCRTLRDPPARR